MHTEELKAPTLNVTGALIEHFCLCVLIMFNVHDDADVYVNVIIEMFCSA